jgi:phosphocarrier protein HPr
MSQAISSTVKIQNRLGLHARPAMAFVDVASTYESQITVKKGDQSVDGKSIMQMMMLAATQGTELLVEAIGPDAQAAIVALNELVNRKFDEE